MIAHHYMRTSLRTWIAGITATTTLGAGGVFAADRAQNPYDDKGTHYELPIVSDIPQGERVEIAKDKAEMTLKGWNDEYAIKITPQIPTAPTFGADKKIDRPFTTQPNRPLLSKKMEYRSGDVTAFIEPKANTENEFDIDFTLHAKPDTNVFEYKIEGAEEFDFFYQPCTDDNVICPQNVIGSYAVYHKTKANHRVGSTNYATGKAFHIYRPKAIDANGAEVWAELSYSHGTLSVTVSPEWLAKASYPVTVDPTLGYTSVGASTEPQAAAFTANPPTMGGDGVMTKIQIAASDGGGDSGIKMALYSDVAGAPTDLISNSSTGEIIVTQTTKPTQDSEWTSSTSVSAALSNATKYWITFRGNGSSVLVYGDTAGDSARYSTVTYANFPADPYVIAGTDGNKRYYSTYLTYTCSTGTCTSTESFIVPGYASWTAPTGVTSADVACWGGGGGGGDGALTGGGGGGGGAFASSTVAVTPDTQYTIFVGAGGSKSTSSTAAGSAGQDSTFATTTVVADGGSGGSGGSSADTNGGAGGTTANSTGDVEFAGGAGGQGRNTGDAGGGGGGGAGPHGAGGDGSAGVSSQGGGGGGGNGGSTATTATGGASTNGGAGGDGDTNGSTAPAGVAGTSNSNGGGGGGGGDDGDEGGDGGTVGAGGGGGENNSVGTTGNGAAGQCTVTYTIAASGGSSPILDQSVIFFD